MARALSFNGEEVESAMIEAHPWIFIQLLDDSAGFRLG